MKFRCVEYFAKQGTIELTLFVKVLRCDLMLCLNGGTSILRTCLRTLLYTLAHMPPSYDALKKYIYQLEKQQHDLGRSSHDLEANERETLIQQATRTATDSVFVPLLDRELKKIVFFYESQEKELLDAVTNLEELVKDQEEAGLAAEHQYLVDGEEDDDDDDDDEPASPSQESGPPKRRRRRSSAAPRYVAGETILLKLLMSLQCSSGNTIPEERSIQHRYSISSSEGSAADLETSVASIHQAPITHGVTSSRAASSSMSPLGKARSIANKFNFMRDSSLSRNDENIWTAKTDFAWDIRILFKRRITALYIQLTSLKSYVEINYSGFRKILKK
jgi:phosphate transporter